MANRSRWWDDEPRRPPAEYACALARDRFWKDERGRFLRVHPDWPDVTYLLGLGEEIAHALVLVLSRLPVPQRRSFASAFFDERRRPYDLSGPQARLTAAVNGGLPRDYTARLASAAELALLVVDLTGSDVLQEATTLDLLRGAAQGDDLTLTPPPALRRLQLAIAKVRQDPRLEDDSDPHAAACIAVLEVIDPSSDTIGVKEILGRAAYATVESRPKPEALAFMLRADEILREARVF